MIINLFCAKLLIPPTSLVIYIILSDCQCFEYITNCLPYRDNLDDGTCERSDNSLRRLCRMRMHDPPFVTFYTSKLVTLLRRRLTGRVSGT